MDYAGPVYLKNVYPVYSEINKAWIALITCANSRCIYLDIAKDYTAEECINVLTRFINRRGAPKEIISDNGSNFISKKNIQSFSVNHNITWKLNTPAAPWTGGFFERMIKSAKRLLRKMLYRRKVYYDERDAHYFK